MGRHARRQEIRCWRVGSEIVGQKPKDESRADATLSKRKTFYSKPKVKAADISHENATWILGILVVQGSNLAPTKE